MKWVLLLFAALVAALAADAAEPSLRAAMLHRGEAALARGEVEVALQEFEAAAALSHAADAEMGIVRAYMQAGEYRRALAFVAHTAGAHRDETASAVLYAYLLLVGGQDVAARRVLAEAQAQFPVTPLGPFEVGELPTAARVSGTGVLIDRGRRALLPLAALGESDHAWVRNGLGHVARAKVEQRLMAEGVAVARLESELPFDADLRIAAKPPFPGSPAFAVAHPRLSTPKPTWPLLATGFVGRPVGGTPIRELGPELSAGGRGGAVFDISGHLLGIAVPEAGSSRLLPVSHLRERLGAALGDAAPETRSPAPVDRIYEGGLRTALQILTLPRGG